MPIRHATTISKTLTIALRRPNLAKTVVNAEKVVNSARVAAARTGQTLVAQKV